jgi:hypothetical protein
LRAIRLVVDTGCFSNLELEKRWSSVGQMGASKPGQRK